MIGRSLRWLVSPLLSEEDLDGFWRSDVPAPVYLRMLTLLLTLAVLFHVAEFLVERARPPFPPPDLVAGQTIGSVISSGTPPLLVACAVSPAGRIALLDARGGVVQVFSASGAFLFSTPADPASAGPLLRPQGVAFGEDEDLYVADTGNQRTLRFTADGAVGSLGRPGVFDGQFVWPVGILAGRDGLVVLDAALCRLQQFAADGSFVGRAGRKGAGPGSFLAPASLARAGDGSILIADSRQGSLTRFDGQLNLVQQRRLGGSAGGGGPHKLAFAGEGLMFCLFRNRQEIVVFHQDTAVRVLQPGDLGLPANAFWTDIAGHGDSVYVLDAANLRLDRLDL